MQIDQLFELVYVLLDKKQVTAKEMAERFGVSTRTIYRWVDALSVSGVPIYSQNGRGGGIAISEKYALDTKVLSEEERLAIVSSVKALNSLSGNPASVVNANIKAAEKISGLVEKDTDWLEVDFAPWSPEGSSVRQVFGTLRDCILQKKQVVFDYYSGDGRMERRMVHPWKLIYKGQAWYLQGWCTTRKAERFFKLTRMQNLDMTGRAANITRIAAKEYETKNNSPAPQKIPDYKPKLLTIKAKVFPQKISYLLDTFICSEVIPHKDDSITATFSVPDQDWIYELLLGFGSNMKIIAPKQVKDQILQIAKDVQKIYKN
ncbi:MAG: YafY family transcriptional regulator [Treponema sp.]|nr:YafY family transcriptional regulator [Treponema sp.]MBR5032956.1 YafY family transcriptional regulator [Treponema sp.]